MGIDYEEFRKAFIHAKKNLRISQDYHISKPSAIGTYIPVRGHKRRVTQKGITRTHRVRQTELDAGKPQVVVKRILLESEVEKRAAVMALWQEAADWSRKRDGHGIYGGARHRWIAGKLGLTVREVCLLLGKNK